MTVTGQAPLVFSDLALARRLETAEARSGVEFVETRARVFPQSGARWIEVAGAYALFDTPHSPVTQTFGIGLFESATNTDLELIERFFVERGASVNHEVSPLAGIKLLTLLTERGYQPIELTSVMFRRIEPGSGSVAPRNERLRARLIQADEQELWARVAARGWSEFTEFADSIAELMLINSKRTGGLEFLTELDGQAIAAGAMSIWEGVALMAGASTIPEARKQGAQRALLDSRLRYAAEHGCDIAMMCAQPGSASQRNAEREGFRIAYTRTKWSLAQPAVSCVGETDPN
jgi:GNAT superfamily N-acetyltransferase